MKAGAPFCDLLESVFQFCLYQFWKFREKNLLTLERCIFRCHSTTISLDVSKKIKKEHGHVLWFCCGSIKSFNPSVSEFWWLTWLSRNTVKAGGYKPRALAKKRVQMSNFYLCVSSEARMYRVESWTLRIGIPKPRALCPWYQTVCHSQQERNIPFSQIRVMCGLFRFACSGIFWMHDENGTLRI